MLLDELDQLMNQFSSIQWEPYSKPLNIELKSQLYSSIEEAPKLELKLLPEYLKYAY